MAETALSVAKEALAVARDTSLKLDRVLELLGEEHEDGCGGYEGTGLLGRVRRTEKAQEKSIKTYEGMFRYGAGAGGTVLALGGLVTFLLSNHIIKIG